MPIDRAATIRAAEKLLRQGKLDAAIAEYFRLLEDQPRDWNTANLLGDLLVRAGKADKAIEQFVTAADTLSDEGALAKAAALYRKILKHRPEHEHALLQCAEIAATQGVLVDARNYFKAVAERRQARGDVRGVAQTVIRLASLDAKDFAARRAGARARLEVKDRPGAIRDLREIAGDLLTQHRGTEAVDVLREAVTLAPDDPDVYQQLRDALIAAGDHLGAREHALTSGPRQRPADRLETRIETDDQRRSPSPSSVGAQADGAAGIPVGPPASVAAPTLEPVATLFAEAEVAIREGSPGVAVSQVRQLLVRDPNARTDVALLAFGHAESQPDLAFALLDLAGDAAIADRDWASAAAGLQELVTRVPSYLPALMRLVEVCVDGGLEATMYAAQAQLCDAYLEAGAGREAGFLAEDLVAREPWQRANLQRFRRALELQGEPDPEALIASRLSGDVPFTSIDTSVARARAGLTAGAGGDQDFEVHEEGPGFEFEAVAFAGDAQDATDHDPDALEVDLSVELDDLNSRPGTASVVRSGRRA